MFKNQVTDGLMVTVTWDLPPSSTEEDVRNLVEEHGSEVTTVRTSPCGSLGLVDEFQK